MNFYLRIPALLHRKIRADLVRPHPIAAERVGWIQCKAANTPTGILLVAVGFEPVKDTDYVPSFEFGALINSNAVRRGLEIALQEHVGVFHVHLHNHRGVPTFSPPDTREHRKLIPDFFSVYPDMPHGAIVLSKTDASGVASLERTGELIPISKITIVGRPMLFTWSERNELPLCKSEFSRHSQ